MSLGTSLSLSKDVVTRVNTNLSVYALRAADMGQSEFSVAGLTLPNEDKLSVRHDLTSGGVQRKVARIDKTVVDSVLTPATASFHVVFTRPPNTAVTNAVIIELVNKMVDFLVTNSNANVTALLNGEV